MKSNTLVKSVPSVQQLEAMRPRDADRLHRLVENLLQVRVVRRAVVPGNDAPFDYLCAAFFEADRGDDAGAAATHEVAPRRDLIVWANRGGGKTLLGAVATVLDMVFKPGIEIRILGGSLKQSSKMHEYLRQMFEREPLRSMVTTSSDRELVLFNRSRVRLLAQSSRSVRGEHVHKLRCDELDEFHDPIWKAAQLVTQSGMCGPVAVRGTVEAISTMHRRFGPMSRLLDLAGERNGRTGGTGGTGGSGARVLKWSALDVMARCPAKRPCEGCPLWDDCQGVAKEAAGHVPVDEMIARRHRTDDDTWAAEMMCRRPRSDAAVFPGFEATLDGPHVATVAAERNEAATATATVATPATLATAAGGTADHHASREGSLLIGGMDFGIRDPFVMLWARLIPPVAGATGGGHGEHRGSPVHRGNEPVHRRDWMLEVFDELIETGLTMEQAVIRMESRGWSKPAWIAADPAGHQLNRQTGISDIGHLRRRGYRIITRPARIEAGIHAIRRRLDRGLIRIDPRCTRLIKNLSQYHFDPDNPQNENPVKDGSDHACDALRYMVMALELGDERVQTRMW